MPKPGQIGGDPAAGGIDRKVIEAMGPDLGALLATTGSAPLRVTAVTGLPSRVLTRGSFRIDLADGRVLKGRRFDEPAHAEGFERLTGLSGLEGLPRVLARRGAATLEAWVPGPSLTEVPVSSALLRACGALLGRLHARPAPSSEAATAPDARARRAALESQLDELERLGLVPFRVARRVRGLVGSGAPLSATVGFIHRDFCPENLVLGPGGRPVAVDNTTLAIDCHDFDLGRTWYRWPMTEARWAPFAEGYRDHRDPGPFVAHRPFWASAALVEAALFRHHAGTPRAEVPIERLRALVGPTPSRRRNPERHFGEPSPAVSASVRLSYGEVAVEVRSTDPAPVRWLEEFLSPWFGSDAGAGADAVVALTEDPSRLDAAHRHVAGSSGWPDCFLLDSRVVRHPARTDDRGRSTVMDTELGVAYLVDPERSTVEIVARGDEPGARVALMRVVRELVTGYVAQHGGLLVHAGALAIGDRAIVVAGPKETGKTTLLLHLLHAPGARFVANDRVVIGAGDEPSVHGMPSIVAVRPGTIGRLPGLRARLRAGSATHWLTQAEVLPLPDLGPLPSGAGADLSPAQLCAALGVAAAPRSALAAFLFPRIEPAGRDVELMPIRGRLARERLAGARFGADPDGRSAVFGWLAGRGDLASPRGSESARRCDELAGRVPCFEARLGMVALDDAEAAAARLATLVA